MRCLWCIHIQCVIFYFLFCAHSNSTQHAEATEHNKKKKNRKEKRSCANANSSDHNLSGNIAVVFRPSENRKGCVQLNVFYGFDKSKSWIELAFSLDVRSSKVNYSFCTEQKCEILFFFAKILIVKTIWFHWLDFTVAQFVFDSTSFVKQICVPKIGQQSFLEVPS